MFSTVPGDQPVGWVVPLLHQDAKVVELAPVAVDLAQGAPGHRC